MDRARILVVEDEGIIAQDIKNCLENLGYEVPDIVYTGIDAIDKAEMHRPDLVLMDIVLKGEIDGIETAAEIKKRYNIPIVYLTAYEDDKTLKRAKVTEPLGYILKPFEERYLRSSIEMALYKHKMECKLKNNERWLATILKSVGDAVIVADSAMNVKYMNPIAEQLTGWTAVEAFGESINNIFRLVDEHTGEFIANPAEKALRENTIVGHTNHAHLISKNGREIAIDDSASPMRDDDGTLSGVVLIFSDITERKKAETALMLSESKYRDLFDNAGEAIFVMSFKGDIISANNEACRLLGYEHNEYNILTIQNIAERNFADNFKNLPEKIKEKGIYTTETRYRSKTGEWIDVEARINIIRFLKEDVFQLFVRDITKLKETQKQITILAQAVKSISECVSITDLNDRLIYVNDAFVRTYGFTYEELKGKTLNIIRSQKNKPGIAENILKETLNGGWQGELINRSRNGREFPVILSTSIVKDDKGEPIAYIGVAMDISERKAFENALRESERDYKGLFENAHDAIIIYRPDDEIILDVNQRASEIYGYSKEEFIGMTLDELASDSSTDRKHFREITERNINARFETVHNCKNRKRMYLEVNSSSVFYKGQRAIVSINRDVSERKKYEKELLDSNARKTAILESSADAIITIDADMNIIEWNKAAENIFGIDRKNAIGRNVNGLIIRENDSVKIKNEIRVLENSARNGELFELITYDSRSNRIYTEVSLSKINLKDTSLYLMNIRDINERIKAQEALRMSEKRYRYVAKATNDAVWDWDFKSRKIEWNEGLNILFGYDKDFLISDFNWWEEQLHPEDKQRVITSLNNAIGRKEQLWSDEYRFRRNDGKYAYVMDRGYVIYDINNEPERMIGCITDLTKRKDAEKEAVDREKRYRDLAESAPIAVTRLNMETQDYEFVNDEFIRQSGYTMEEYNKLSPDELVNMIYEEDREKVFDFYEKWNESHHKGTQHIDYRIVNRRNELLWLDTYLYADYDSDGKLKAVNQLCIDITEQKKTQEKINQSEKRFRSLIENSSDMIALLDKEGKIVYASPSTQRILGYKLKEFEGKHAFDFIYKDDIEKIKRIFIDIYDKPGVPIYHVLRVYNVHREPVWIEATATNFIDDPIVNSIVVNYRDITERKKAEDEVLLQKSYFQQLFENSPEAIVILNNEDKVVDVNKGFEKLFQFTKDEIKDKQLNRLIVPAEHMEKAQQMSKFVLRGEVIHKETMRKRKDGSIVDVSLLAYPILLGKDQIGVYGIYSDISERTQTAKQLKNSEERYKVFVKQSSEGIWRFEFIEPVPVDLSVEEQVEKIYRYGYLAECNDSFAKMYGYNTADEIIGIHLTKLMPQSDPEKVQYLTSFVRSGYRITETETKETDKNGELKHFINNLVGITENGILIRAWGTQRDITMAKNAEMELHKTQFRLATLLKNLPDVVLYESGGESEFITDNVKDLLGHSSSEFNDPHFFNSILHPEDLEETNRQIKEWTANGNPGILNLEFRCKRADGEYIWIEDHMVSLKESGRNILAGVLVDITDRKKSEDKLHQLAEKLSDSNRELEQFAYVASHDLQEPLRMVASYIQLLQRRYKDKLSDEANEFIDYAVDGVVRMKTLINDLLIYSRVNTREMPLEEVDINAILEKVKTNLRSQINENDALIKYGELPVITANKLQISQLFQNLISNAIKFQKDHKPVVEITGTENGNGWQFSVKDNGIGIEREYADKIFEIFQRLHNYKDYPGTGIGLAICKKIIEKHGGNISVESEPGQGATFFFTIPRMKEVTGTE